MRAHGQRRCCQRIRRNRIRFFQARGAWPEACARAGQNKDCFQHAGSALHLDANPGMKQTQLADAIQLDRSSVVSVLDKLEARGLVERVRAPDNRRANALHLTTEGRHILDSLIPQVRAHEERVLGNLDPAERAQLQKLLGRLVLAAG